MKCCCRNLSLALAGIVAASGIGLTFMSLTAQRLAQKSKNRVKASTRSNARGAAGSNQAGANQSELEAQRGEWSRWRGPNGDGISKETGLLKEWPEEGPTLAWRTRGLGKGFGSVAVVGDRIYTLGQLDDSNHLLCLNRADGSQIWKAHLGPKIQTRRQRSTAIEFTP